MFTKGNTVYSDAFKYLRHKNINKVAMQVKGDSADYYEEDFSLPLHVEIDRFYVKIGDYFVAKPQGFSYGAIKAAVIKMRYSNDDQMAIILNKDNSVEDAMYYQKMQEWRDFASEVARKAVELLS